MSLPTRNNPYSFEEFLEKRRTFNYYLDDPFFQKVVRHFAGDQWEEIHEELVKISDKVSYRWRDFAETIAWPEKRPYMMHYDGHNIRIDRIVRPRETEIMENEIFSEGLFSERTSPWLRLAKMYLIYQNGDAR